MQYLPVLDIYYSQTGVYSVDQRRTGTWLLLLSEGMSTPLRPLELFQWFVLLSVFIYACLGL